MGYYVHVPGRGEPNVEHAHYADALNEANRLALKHKTDVRIYETKATVKIKYTTEVNNTAVGIKDSDGKEYCPGDCVLFVDFDKSHQTGIVKSVKNGMVEISARGDILKAVAIEDVVCVIH